MSDPFSDALAIISERGSDINLVDMRKIEGLILECSLETAADMQGWIYEALWLIVNDPLYEGDIPPIE